MTRRLVVLLALACGAAEPGAPSASGTPAVAADPATDAAHAALFAAAEKGELKAFVEAWSPASRALLEAYFDAVATLERDPGAPPVDWRTFMQAHADLPAAARAKRPYRLVGRPPRLDLTQRPEAQFFRDAARTLQPHGAPAAAPAAPGGPRER